MKDYKLKTLWLDDGQPNIIQVCATDAIDAISEAWQIIDKAIYPQVDTFEIITIHQCEHQKGRVV